MSETKTYDNNNRGALWSKISQKQTRYYSGKININGVDYRITGFINEEANTANGQPEIRLRVNDDEYVKSSDDFADLADAVKPLNDDELPF